MGNNVMDTQLTDGIDAYAEDPARLEPWQCNVWVGNYGKYNEGYLVGGWLTLPAPKDVIDRFLRDVVMIGDGYEEYGIFDTWGDGLEDAFGVRVEEGDLLEHVDTLCRVARDVTMPAEAVRLAAECQCVNSGDLTGWANLMLQADDIPWCAYEDDDPCMSQEAKLAWTLTEEGALPELKAFLDSPLGCHVDMEAVGRDIACDGYTLGDEGYLYPDDCPDSGTYTMAEIAADVRAHEGARRSN